MAFEYKIYRGNDVFYTAKMTGTVTTSVMGEDVVNCQFRDNEFIDFQIGDRFSFFGKNYYLNIAAEPTKTASNEYNYSLQFEADFYNLSKILFRGLDSNNLNNEPEFVIMANAEMLIDLILQNMVRYGSGWAKGTVEETPLRNFQFQGENCLQVLTKIADEYKMEFWFNGRKISFGTRVILTAITFEYGRGKGLYDIRRVNNQNTNTLTRVYVTGSDRNVPEDYRDYSKKLLLPAAYGYYLENSTAVTQFGLIEGYKNFPEIYPKRIGTVTAVSSLPDEFNRFTDADIDFDVNDYLLSGQTAKVTFVTGVLAGWEFELSQYDHSTKSFRFNKNEDEKAVEVPSVSLRPAVGDTYFLFDIAMPESYVTAAETELYNEAVKYLAEVSNPANKYQYNVTCDPLYLRRNGIEPTVKYNCRIIDTDMGIDDLIRINRITRQLDDLYSYELEITNQVRVNPLTSRDINNQKITQTVRQLDSTQMRRVNSYKAFFNRLRDFMGDVFDTDGYFDGSKIKPNSIETIALKVGVKSQNFKLSNILIKVNYNGSANSVYITAGDLVHLEIEIAGIGYTWEMQEAEFSSLDPAKSYWLYARCSKIALVGNWVLTEANLSLEHEAGYYHFLVGRLYKVIDNYRVFDLTSGVSTIVGSTITTGRIQDASGENYFDLDSGEARFVNAFLRGGIEADSGYIGDITIEDGKLSTPDNGVVIDKDGIVAKKGKIGMLDIGENYLSLNQNVGGTADTWAANTNAIAWTPDYFLLRKNSDSSVYRDRVIELAFNLYSGVLGMPLNEALRLKSLRTNNVFGAGVNRALHLEAKNADINEALRADGDVVINGNMNVHDVPYSGTIHSNTLILNIAKYKVYIVKAVATGGLMNLRLPKEAEILSVIGRTDISFEVTILMSKEVGSGRLAVANSSTAPLYDHNGNVITNLELAKGDCLKIRYFENGYYIVGRSY